MSEPRLTESEITAILAGMYGEIQEVKRRLSILERWAKEALNVQEERV